MDGNYFDASTMRQALSGPGMDTRQWISYGRVEPDSPDARNVLFDEADSEGTPLGQVIVTVKLEPSATIVPCRIGGMVAGNGEGEYYPFIEGDEVLVAIPEGDEKAGCVIISRLGQSLDAFPLNVGGADVTKNNFGFRRMRAPFILETAESYMMRGTTAKWQLTFDRTGNVFLASGAQHQLVLHADGITLGSGDEKVSIQMNPSDSSMTLKGNGTTLLISDSGSQFFTGGQLAIATAGLPASGNAVTLQQVLNLLINWTILLTGPMGSPKLMGDLVLPGAIFFPGTFPTVLDTAVSAMLTLAATPAPPIPPVTAGGGALAIMPLTFAALKLALGASAAIPDPGAFGLPPLPGIGKAALLF